ISPISFESSFCSDFKAPLVCDSAATAIKTIVTLGLAGFSLLRFDYTKQSRFDEASSKHRLVHQHENIKRIAIFSDCAWDRSEIERKNSAMGQNCLQFISINFEIERILIAAAFRSVDYHI